MLCEQDRFGFGDFTVWRMHGCFHPHAPLESKWSAGTGRALIFHYRQGWAFIPRRERIPSHHGYRIASKPTFCCSQVQKHGYNHACLGEPMTKIYAALVVWLLFALPQWAQGLEWSGVPYAITNVTVVDTTGGPSRPNFTVVIEGDRISYVGKGHFHALKQAHVIDGTGKFLIPGLWDMHVHTFFGDWIPGGKEVTLPLFIANGITGVRDMGSDLDLILAARRDTASGSMLGPRMIVAGPMLDGPKTQFPASIAIATPDDG